MALDIEDLVVHRGRRRVLDGVSTSVRAGEVVGILGPNGAGKSTLLKAALGLLPATGTVRLLGDALDQLSAGERARRVAYVPQERDVAWSLDVTAIVALGRLPHRPAFAALTSEDHLAIDNALAATDLTTLRDQPITALSGGERARALIARALAQQAPILLADEPTSGLDPAHQLMLLALFRKLAGEGAAIALSIHELHLAARWCDRVVLLDAGRIAASGSPDDVITRHNIREVYGCDVHIAATPAGPVVVPIALTSTETSSYV